MQAAEREKSIGIFDSGLGGLAVASEVTQRMPDEDILYFADFANLPFGPKPQEEVRGFVGRIVEFLLSKEVKAVVIACNTATVAGLERAKEIAQKVPVVGMINPAVETVLGKEKFNKVGVIGTAGTINSRSYEKAFRMKGWEKPLFGNACPDLLRLAEKGNIEDQEQIDELADKCVSPLLKKEIDALILGCTDFTCVKEAIKNAVPSNVDVIDPAREVALTVNEKLNSNNQTAEARAESHLAFYHTDGLPDKAEQFARNIFDLTIDEIVSTDI